MFILWSRNTSRFSLKNRNKNDEKLNKFINSRTYLILFALSLILIDQSTKFIVSSRLVIAERWDILNPIKDYFSIVFVSNPGIFFGLFEKYGEVFLYFSILISAVIVYGYPKVKGRLSIQVGLIFILSGAIGNVIDRLLYGYVVDILLLANYLVVNLADIFVITGLILVAWGFLFKSDGDQITD